MASQRKTGSTRRARADGKPAAKAGARTRAKAKAKAKPRKKAARPKSTRRNSGEGSASGRRAAVTKPAAPAPLEAAIDQQINNLIGGIAGLTSSALRLAGRTRDTANRAIARSPEQLRMMAAAGESLRDMRQVLGLTAGEIADALNLRDRGILQAIEEGREVLSFELILRMASLYARNDPLPFILKYTRTYQPRLWAILHELGIDSLPLNVERERSFVNIYRRHDSARNISDAGFERVLGFTQQAFDMALEYVAAAEGVSQEGETPASAKGRRRR